MTTTRTAGPERQSNERRLRRRARAWTTLLLAVASAAAGGFAGMGARSLTAVREHEVAGQFELRAQVGGVAEGERGPVLRVFGDYQCPACRELERVAGDSLRALARRGRLRFVYHHSPLGAHRRGPLAAAAAYCAQQFGSPWLVHGALYDRAPVWSAGEDPVGRVAAASARGGVDPGRMRACLDARLTATQVERDRALANRLGIRAVPTVFVDDARIEFRSYHALLRYVTRRAIAS
jgi:protein-disulfide isomerase